MRLFFIAFFLLTVSIPSKAQTVTSKVGEVYQIPFASSNNRIELDVVNTGGLAAENVRVTAVNKPAWLSLDADAYSIPSLASDEKKVALFVFSIERTAEVGQPALLKFDITSNNTLIGTKEFQLEIEAPKEAALMQNYPNPFNPETTIGYDVPHQGIIDLRVFDLLGREIALLASGEKSPGHYQVRWNASEHASGTYFYLLKMQGLNGEHVLLSKKMLLVK